MFRNKRYYRRIHGVIGSSLCSVLWIYVTVQFAASGRNVRFPLAAAVVFSICAFVEISNFRKYGNDPSVSGPKADEKKKK